MKTWATKQLQLKGWTKEDAITEIAHFDGVDRKEAERRYDWAHQSQIKRSVAMEMSHEAGRKALDDAKADFRLGRRVHYSRVAAEKFKRYYNNYWSAWRKYEDGTWWP